MRKLMWFAMGFAAACGIGAYLVSGHWLLLLALFCFGCTFASAYLLTKGKKETVLVLAGLIAAFVWMWIFDTGYLRYARKMDAQKIETTVTITDYSEPASYGIVAEGRIQLEGRSFKIRIYRYDFTPLQPGDTLHGNINLKYTQSEGWSDYYSSAGTYLVGYVENGTAVSRPDKISARYFAAVLRRNITDILDKTFPSDVLGFARALLIGDSSLLSYETDTDLTVSGIKHIVAVSGQHVSILFCVIFAVFGYRRVITPLVGLPTLLLFAALTGFTPSVNRACLMQALMILALMFDKEYDPPTALAFSVLTMLTANPMTVASVGFQLSVGCVIGILLFYEKIRTYLLQEKRLGTGKGKSLKAKLTRWLASSISMTLSTMVMTTPLCAIYFGMVSLVSIVTNLLTLWVVSFIFYGVILACIFGALWLPLGVGIAWLIAWPIRYVLLMAKLLASVPFAAVYTDSQYIVMWLILCYGMLAMFMLQKKKRPALLLCCILVSLCVAIGLSWAEPKLEDYRLTVFDVGQGQCTLVQKGDRYYLIDCGGDYAQDAADTAVHALLSQGVTEIDGLILTHYDKDHAEGAEYFLSRIPAANIYLPDIEDTGSIRETLVQKYYSRIVWIGSEESLVLEEGMLQLFAGDAETPDNESGLCILCRLENCDILITGDRSLKGEKALMEQVELPDIEVLVAGHHGSGNSTGRPLLEATKPELVIISVGEDNSYGHPSEKVLERLALFNCKIVTTADNGTIVIRG